MTILSNYNGDIDCWRKMQFNSVKRGNFSRMAGHVNKVMDQAFQAGRETAVDNTAIAKESIKGRSLERRAAMKAEGEVAQAGLKAFTKVKKTKNEIDSANKINDILRPAKRMAGVVAGLGAISQAAVMQKNLKDDKADRAVLRAEEDALAAKRLSMQEQLAANQQEILKSLRQPGGTPGVTTPPSGGTPPKPSGSASSVTGSATQSSPQTVSSDISAQHSAGPGAISKSQINQYALDAGFSPEQARTVVGIAGGESGFDPSNSTRRSGLYAKTGEDSVGLMQINWGYHKDKGWLQGLGINKREDLLDPQKNMKAAKYLYDGRGNFGDWTVYNKGIYKDFL